MRLTEVFQKALQNVFSLLRNCPTSRSNVLDRRDSKTLTQCANEIGITKSTVGRWLRRDHWPLWMEYWALAEEMWEAAQQDRQQPDRRARRLADEEARKALLASLDRSLAELTSGGHLDAMHNFRPGDLREVSRLEHPHGRAVARLMSRHRHSLRGGGATPALPYPQRDLRVAF